MNTENVMHALDMLGQGMLGIFVVILVIWALVALLGRVTR